MILSIIYLKQGKESTLTSLLVDGVRLGYTVADTDRFLTQGMTEKEIAVIKVHGSTAIPTGRYAVQMTMSDRFQRMTPQLMSVPGFGGIRIHAGNYIGDTEGCILPGLTYDQDAQGYYRVWSSRDALAIVQKKIDQAINRNEKIWCDVSRLYQKP